LRGFDCSAGNPDGPGAGGDDRYPAQVAAIILLVASIAAIVLTLRQRAGHKPQDIAKQVAVRAKDRVRIVKMAAEKKP